MNPFKLDGTDVKNLFYKEEGGRERERDEGKKTNQGPR